MVMPAKSFVPIERTWGFCLLGFYGGGLPGKEATLRAAARWSRCCKVSFHPNGGDGWIIFRFATEDDKEVIRRLDTQYVYGIPLILCSSS